MVGCGAVSRANLLPVLSGHARVSIVALVDRDLARARELARAYSVPQALTDLEGLQRTDLDAVVLATPPAHHAPATLAMATRGWHVFVEKPMATSPEDAEAMVAAADGAGVALAVGLYRRLLPSVRLLRSLIESEEYGAPLSVDIEEGGAYGWPLASLDLLSRSMGGGGVLMDIGSHVIDVLLYAVPGTARLVSYEDNARGGIETDCLARLDVTVEHRRIPVRLELSRTRELRNSIRVQCERATIELRRGNFTQLHVHRPDESISARTPPLSMTVTAGLNGRPYLGYDALRAPVDDWVTAIAAGSTPTLSGQSVLPVVGVIDECYAHRTPSLEPWTDEGLCTTATGVSIHTAKRRRVLVTGAGGFVGGRAVELLGGRQGWEIVALVREPKSAARLARWPTEIRIGDVCSAADMDRAVRGCDAVVHCAVGTSWRPEESSKVTIEGTRTVAQAALRAGVRRFVHLSTMNVHRRDGIAVVDETVPLQPPAGDRYGRTKLLAEQALRHVSARGLSCVVLRPTRIYGPFSKTFTVRPLEALHAGRFAIAGDPEVPANMVYVDNVVAAIELAVSVEAGPNESAYLITDPEQLTLREFYAYFARAMGAEIRLVSSAALSDDPQGRPGWISRWTAGLRTIVLSPEVRALVHRIMDTDPVGTLPRRLWEQSPKLRQSLLRKFHVDAAVIYRPASAIAPPDLVYSGDPGLVMSHKAERELGFVAPISRARAMSLTLQWAGYARLVRDVERSSQSQVAS